MMPQSEFGRVAAPFATAIAALATAWDESAHPFVRKAVREAIDQLIRKCHDAVMPGIRPAAASDAAKEVAAAWGKDLGTLRWGQEPRVNGKKGDKLLFLEHVTPVSDIRRRCVAEPTSTAVLSILEAFLQAAWITPAENAELHRLGYKSERRHPRAAYEHAKIVIEAWPWLTPELPAP